MKRKSLSALLQKLDSAQNSGAGDIVNLNDQLGSRMLKGGYVVENAICSGGQNATCNNGWCVGGKNGSCTNTSCLI